MTDAPRERSGSLRTWLRLHRDGTSTDDRADGAGSQTGEAGAHRAEAVGKCLELLNDLCATTPGPLAESATPQAVAETPDERAGFGQMAPLSEEQREQDDRPRGRFGRFFILQQLGRGGHGIVYLAHDPLLKRDVALKIPRPDSLASPDLRRRFVNEARLLARLEHPNLVPVLEAGSVGPVCYLVAPYCAGPSLAEWLARQGRPVACEQAARLVRDLAEAVDYMHSRGVLHRDIKPSNVLLEPAGSSDGETGSAEYVPKLTDFGLARPVEGAGTRTATGSVLGTPAYMAPEQAEGRLADTGTTSDVYALGATLFELLTGQPPFRGSSELETLRLVAEGKVAAPQSLRGDVPTDLNAICVKCLEHQPRDRYHSARELAEDLAAYLDDRPVRARPCGPLRRTVKWSRRRPLISGLAVALVVSLVTGLGAAWWQWERAEEHRAAAEKNFLLAHGAVNRFHEILLKEDAYESPEFYPLWKELLEAALPYYDALLAQQSTSPSIRADLADAYFRLGHISHAAGSQLEAVELFRKAARLWQRLVEEEPANLEYRYFLAKMYYRVGQILSQDNRPIEARESIERAVAIQEQLVEAQPRMMGPRLALSEMLRSLMRCHLADGDVDEAGKLAARAVDLCKEIPGQTDARPSWVQRYLGDAYVACAEVGHAAGDNERAIGDCRRALAIHRGLVEQDLEMPTSASRVTKALSLLAAIYSQAGDDRQAAECYRRTIEAMEALVARYPDVASFRRRLAYTYMDLGGHHAAQRRFPDALDAHRQATQLLVELARKDPTAEHIGRLARSYNLTADVLYSLDRLTEATRALDAARDVLAEAKQPAFAGGLDAGQHKAAARIRTAAGDLAGAAEDWRRALELLQEQMEASGRNPKSVATLAGWTRQLGRLCLQLGKTEEAVEPLQNALAACEDLVRRHPEVEEYRRELARACISVSNFSPPANADVAVTLCGRAVCILENLIEGKAATPDDHYLRVRAHVIAARALVNLRCYREAVRQLRRADDLAEGLSAAGVRPDLVEYMDDTIDYQLSAALAAESKSSS